MAHPTWRRAVEALEADLRSVLDRRLRSLVVYEAHGLLGDTAAADGGDGEIRHDDHIHTLAVVDGLSYQDLARLAPLAANWSKAGLAAPLLLPPRDLARSLDAFPLEFSQIVARHVVVAGDDPFVDARVSDEDLRRACETQARSHLLHLREGFIEAAGNPRAVASLVAASAVPLRALLVNLARLYGAEARTPAALEHFVETRLHIGLAGLRPLLQARRAEALRDLDAGAFFPAYLSAVEQLVSTVDEWTR